MNQESNDNAPKKGDLLNDYNAAIDGDVVAAARVKAELAQPHDGVFSRCLAAEPSKFEKLPSMTRRREDAPRGWIIPPPPE